MLKMLLAATAAAAFAAPAAAATTYYFSLTGDYPATWSIPASATPDLVGASASVFENITYTLPGNTAKGYWFTFYFSQGGGGIDISDPNDNQNGDKYRGTGEEIYTGTLASPTFKLGAFTLTDYGGPQTGTLTISDTPPAGVPEPAGWTMMIVGVGLTGAAMRRRRAGALTA